MLHGYLLKGATTAKLLNGIDEVPGEKYYFDDGIAGVSAEDQFTESFAQKLNRTFREIEIIRLIKNGFTNVQISEQLHLSFSTI